MWGFILLLLDKAHYYSSILHGHHVLISSYHASTCKTDGQLRRSRRSDTGNRVAHGIIPLEEMYPRSKLEETGEETMNTAQVLVELLKEYGVEYVFGVPGDTSMVLYDALYAACGEITHV